MNLGNPQVPIISRHYEQVVVSLCRERWISLDDAIIILIICSPAVWQARYFIIAVRT